MRQFISSSAPDGKGLLKISGKDYRYLKQVLRLKSGDMLAVRLPDGTLQNTTVCSVEESSRCVILQVCGDSETSSENASVTRGTQASEVEAAALGVEYYLFQYIAKPVKMEQIIRQAVECGVKYIVPVIGEYSQKSSVLAMQSSKKDRIERIIREARQQSGSPVETEVLEPVSTADAISLWKKACDSCGEGEKAEAVVLWERNENTRSLKEILSQGENRKITKVAIAVGCEGGISPNEVSELGSGAFATIHFPGNILRCETAALYGIAAVQSTITQ